MIKCSKHPKYKVMRRPRALPTKCLCYYMWIVKQRGYDLAEIQTVEELVELAEA